MLSFEFKELPDEQPPVFAAAVEQSHHNTDSYITAAERASTAGADALPPVLCDSSWRDRTRCGSFISAGQKLLSLQTSMKSTGNC